MEHYYIITGNEFGADISSKKNFHKKDFDIADQLFENLKNSEDHICIGFFYVNEEGVETEIDIHVQE